jgi:hypothetical protein
MTSTAHPHRHVPGAPEADATDVGSSPLAGRD